MTASEQNYKDTIATNHLSALLQFAPKLEIFCLAWRSPTHKRIHEKMDVQELRSLH